MSSWSYWTKSGYLLVVNCTCDPCADGAQRSRGRPYVPRHAVGQPPTPGTANTNPITGSKRATLQAEANSRPLPCGWKGPTQEHLGNAGAPGEGLNLRSAQAHKPQTKEESRNQHANK